MGRHRIHVQGRTGADAAVHGLTDHLYLPAQHLKGHLPECYSSLNFMYKLVYLFYLVKLKILNYGFIVVIFCSVPNIN